MERKGRRGVEGPTKCWYCTYFEQKTITHVFLRSSLANRTCSYVASCAGILIEGLTFRETIIAWCNKEVKGRVKPYFQSLASMIIWEIWKRRNSLNHDGKNLSIHNVIFNIKKSKTSFSQ